MGIKKDDQNRYLNLLINLKTYKLTSKFLKLLPVCMFSLMGVALDLTGQDNKIQKGKELFIVHCSRCHGVQGGGGEGPSLNKTYLPRASDDASFANIIENGIPGTSMPGNWMLGKKEMEQVIGYVRSLSSVEKESFTGDAKKGLTVFETAGCFSCHAVQGKGVSLGPDLRGISLRRSSSYISEVLVNPTRSKITDMDGFALYQVVELTTIEGKSIKGLRMNEDTYSIQLKDLENKIYSFRKEKLKSIRRNTEEGLMPSFSKKLTDEEKRDLTAFLLNLK
jgi:cytochrome c oxidase cbb3-type subunit 3